MTFWVSNWLRAFGITLFVELLVALPLLARTERRWPRRIAGVVLVNLATHPLVWFVFPALGFAYATRTAMSEVWAFTLEFGGYLTLWPALGFRGAGLIALAANAASYTLGIALYALGWI